MRILIASSRAAPRLLSDVNAYDFEDAVLDATGADLLLAGGDRSALRPAYDLAIVAGISFRAVADHVARIEAEGGLPPAGRRIAYVLGGYGSAVVPRGRRMRQLLRWMSGNWPGRFRGFDCLYLGIPDDAADIAAALGVPTRYLPMAANVLPVQAEPFRNRADRPIAVVAPGRQHDTIADAICDRLNRPDSRELALRYSPWAGSLNDLPRYRAMFWQILRQSRVLMAFDHNYANPSGREVLSHVGPRWFEAYAAGAVVAGRGPDTPEAAALLGWTDACIEVPDAPATAADQIAALLADEDRLRAASRRNLAEVHARHDWRHRLARLLEVEGLAPPDRLAEQLQSLRARAEALGPPDHHVQPEPPAAAAPAPGAVASTCHDGAEEPRLPDWSAPPRPAPLA